MAVNIYYITLFPSLSHPISLHDRRRMFYTQYLLLRSFSHWVSCAGSGQVHWTRWLLLLLFLSSSFLFAFTFHTNTRYCFFQPNRPTQNEKCIYCCFFKRKSLNCDSVCIILYIDANAWFDCRFQWNQHDKKRYLNCPCWLHTYWILAFYCLPLHIHIFARVCHLYRRIGFVHY